jgi:hypothetical protein
MLVLEKIRVAGAGVNLYCGRIPLSMEPDQVFSVILSTPFEPAELNRWAVRFLSSVLIPGALLNAQRRWNWKRGRSENVANRAPSVFAMRCGTSASTVGGYAPRRIAIK